MKIFQGKNRKYRTERVPFPIYSPIACRVAYDGKPESPSRGRRLRYRNPFCVTSAAWRRVRALFLWKAEAL